MAQGNALAQLQRKLLFAARSIEGYEPGSAIGLFRAFNLTGFEHKGQISSGIGESGTSVTLGASFNAGDLICPLLFTAKAGVELTGAAADYSMVLVHRHPTSLDFAGSTQWHTVRPVSLSVMVGTAYDAKASVSAELGFGLATDQAEPLGIDELGVEISGEVKAGGGLRFLNLKDLHPRHYASATDNDLALDFFDAVDAMTRREMKNLIDDWTIAQEAKLAAQAQSAAVTRSRAAVAWVKGFFSESAEKKDDGSPPAPGKLTAVKRVFRNVASEDLVARLTTLRAKLEAASGKKLEDVRSTPSGETKEARAAREALRNAFLSIETFLGQVERLQNAKLAAKQAGGKGAPIPYGPAPKPSNLCFLDLWSWSADAKAGLAAVASATSKLSANASLSAGCIGRGIHYRFQTTAGEANGEQLVVTQDAVLSYRQYDKEAVASLTAGKRDLPKGKESCYRTMTYRAAVAYWRHPATPAAQPMSVTPGTGSGVSFGTGVKFSELIDAAQELTKAQPSTSATDLVANIAKQLKVSVDTVERFLDAAQVRLYQDNDVGAEVILIEANYAVAPAAAPIALQTKDVVSEGVKDRVYVAPDLLNDKTWKGLVDGLAPATAAPAGGPSPALKLDALRLRYRLSDTSDRSDSVFKLGISYIVGLKVDIKKVRIGGQEGVIDIFTQFEDPELDKDPLKGHERAVSPVALVHH